MKPTAAELAGFELKLENEDGYFVGTLPGRIRVGLVGCISTDFFDDHELYSVANSLTVDTVEDFFDTEVVPRH